MIDFHSHILPGLDDGAIDVDESIAIARAQAAFGYTHVCCTPHCIRGYYEDNAQKVREATLILQADLDNAGIALELWPGMEYMLDECFDEFADELMPLGKTGLVLCEAPPQAHPMVVKRGLELIMAKGLVPLIAHPERTPMIYQLLTAPAAADELHLDMPVSVDDDTEVAAPRQGFLRRMLPSMGGRKATVHKPSPLPSGHHELPQGCLYQANLGSFSGFYGADVQRRAYELLKLGVYSAVASDLHDSRSAQVILNRSKIEQNPILQKLAGFDGTPKIKQVTQNGRTSEQGELF